LKNNADTLEKWVAVLPKLRQRMNEDKDIFKKIYKFAGKFICELNKNNPEVESALAV